jgi:hypothetical protein
MSECTSTKGEILRRFKEEFRRNPSDIQVMTVELITDEARKEIFEEVQRLNRTGRSVPMLENVLLKWFGAKSP